MTAERTTRTTRTLSVEEKERLRRQRAAIAAEVHDLFARDRLRAEAMSEPTLSGELRRAVHASGRSLAVVAAEAGIEPVALDEFLTGERTLRSDVLDRLGAAIDLHFPATR